MQKGNGILFMCCPDAELNIRTFRALSDKQMILSKLEDVSDELARDMVSGGWTGKTVTLKYKLDTYQGNSHSWRPRIFLGIDEFLFESSLGRNRLTVGLV